MTVAMVVNSNSFGISFKKAALIISIIDMTFAAVVGLVTSVSGVMISLALILDFFEASDGLGGKGGSVVPLDSIAEEFNSTIIMYAFLALMSFGAVCYFWLAITLKHGVEQEDLKKCRTWLQLSSGICASAILLQMIYCFQASPSPPPELELYQIFFQICRINYMILCLLVVYKFMNELKAKEYSHIPAGPESIKPPA